MNVYYCSLKIIYFSNNKFFEHILIMTVVDPKQHLSFAELELAKTGIIRGMKREIESFKRDLIDGNYSFLQSNDFKILIIQIF